MIFKGIKRGTFFQLELTENRKQSHSPYKRHRSISASEGGEVPAGSMNSSISPLTFAQPLRHFPSFHPAKRLFLSLLILCFSFFAWSCSGGKGKSGSLFEVISPDVTNITFKNTLSFNPEFNIYKYRNFYNGGGVGLGDISGDSLPDLFLTGNMVSNRLYLNKGNFEFEDITDRAGVAGKMAWSTGVSFVDINGDDWLDIYVTNSSEVDEDKRRNELFINNGDLTFTERAAEYGLDDPGYGTHAVFFDYDGDSDLDMYLLNNSNKAISSFDIQTNERDIRNNLGGDKLFRNDKGQFVDVSAEAGVHGSEIGLALSASVGDVNRDGWPDLYVANDFFERDYLYLNTGEGRFREGLAGRMGSISYSSMGSDIADLNGDGWPEIYVADMLPNSESRLKTISTFEDWSTYQDKERYGYGHQYMRNTLQLNNGDGRFSEVGRLAGVEATDWSWAVLLADYDHNGAADIFVTNGLAQDITNLDYLGEIRTPDMVRAIITGKDANFKQLIDMIPSQPVGDVIYSGQGGLRFADSSRAWGLDTPGFSGGAAWGDLDGDGALDLVVSQVNAPARVYRNRAVRRHPHRGWLAVELQGEAPNTQAVGAQLSVWAGGRRWHREHQLQRGFQSSVAPGLHLGLGRARRVDSLRVRWPDGRITRRKNIRLPGRITLQQAEAGLSEKITIPKAHIVGDGKALATEPLLEEVTDAGGIDWQHRENDYSDFDRERLAVHMRSTEGPALCSGDITGDGLEDLYLGGARGQAGALYLQQSDGSFAAHKVPVFGEDADSEDTDCALFDANSDGHLDLYVTSGGNSFSAGSTALLDRLYFGDGAGGFRSSELLLPTRRGLVSSSSVTVGDLDGDGHADLFVGERLRLFAVGLPARGFLLQGNGEGGFTEVTEQWAPELAEAGMLTDAVWVDWDGDGRQDLIVVGEWMAPRVFRNTGERLQEVTEQLGLEKLSGWWNAVRATDLNGDSRPELVLGNHGLNSRFKASPEHPVRMWVGDFSGNGVVDQILSRNVDGQDYPVALRHELLEAIPQLAGKYPDYASYGGQTVQDIFSADQLSRAHKLEATELASVIVWNEGPEKPARVERMPLRAQLAPMYGVWSGDLDGDEQPELVLGGNLHEVKPIVGRYDASRGVVVRPDGPGQMTALTPVSSGLSLDGAVRAITSIEGPAGTLRLIVARNDTTPVVFRVKRTNSRLNHSK